jgi:hypothetical protein
MGRISSLGAFAWMGAAGASSKHTFGGPPGRRIAPWPVTGPRTAPAPSATALLMEERCLIFIVAAGAGLWTNWCAAGTCANVRVMSWSDDARMMLGDVER